MNYFIIPGIKQDANCERILHVISEQIGIDIFEKSRKREICEARHLAMFLLREFTTMSLSQIGNLFLQNHATVIHAINNIKNLKENNKPFKKRYKTLFTYFNI